MPHSVTVCPSMSSLMTALQSQRYAHYTHMMQVKRQAAGVRVACTYLLQLLLEVQAGGVQDL